MTVFPVRTTLVSWRVTASTLMLIVGGAVSASNAQAPDTPSLLTPVEDYRGAGTPGEDGGELQEFRSSDFDAGVVAWMMIGSVVSLFTITPGLLFFYCGLLRTHDSIQVILRYLGLVALLSMTWVLWMYSLAFDRNVHSHDVLASERLTSAPESDSGDRLLGGTEHFGMRGLDSQLGDEGPAYPLRRQHDKVPHILFMTYQLMCFISVPVPLAVALNGRLTMIGTAGFVVLWGTIVYAPISYWIWGGGWHAAVLDTAGGIPAHVTVGFSGLAATWILRHEIHRRREQAADPTNHFVLLGLGATLFWCGSVICNASRSLAADGYAVNAFVTTFLAGCAGLIGWVGTEWLVRGKAGLTGFCAGPFVGLIAIAAGTGYVAPQSSIVIGLLGGAIGYRAYGTIERRYPGNALLLVFALHAVGGVLGTLLAGVFATASVAGFDQEGNAIAGMIVGDPTRLVGQAWAIVSAATLATVGTLVALKIVQVAGGVCSSETTAPDEKHGK